MKKHLLSLLLVLGAMTGAWAQLSLSATPTASTCSANGTITCTATGGSGGNQFQITAPAASVRPLQNSNIFNNIGAGTYTVQVSNGAGQTASTTVTVTSTYVLPTLNAPVIAGNTVTVTVVGGKPNFTFQYSIDNFATVSGVVSNSTNRSATFSCLRNNSYQFRVTDDCQNFYTVNGTVNLTPLEAAWSCGPNNTITFGGVNGGIPPYTYKCYRPNGSVLTSSTGAFINITECRDSLTVTDACGTVFTQILTCQRNTTPLLLNVTCSNATGGTASMTASGGTPPYRFVETQSGISGTAAGQFTGLPDTDFNFRVSDACGNTFEALISKMQVNYEPLCVWGVRVSSNHLRATTSVPNPVNFSYFPVTYKCIDCVPQITKVDATGDAMNRVLFEKIEGGKTIEVTNRCGEKRTIVTEKGTCVQVDCSNNVFVSKTNPSTYGATYSLKDSTGAVVRGPDTLGVYFNVPPGLYTIVATNPRMIPTTVTINVNTKPRIINVAASCDMVNLTVCPNTLTFVTKAYLNGVFVSQANGTSIGGLQSGTSYDIRVFTTAGVFIDKTIILTRKVLAPNVTTTCNSITATVPLVPGNQRPFAPTYTINTVPPRTNTTGVFTNVPAGTYTVVASDQYCGSAATTATVGERFIQCIIPSFKAQANGTCAFAWDIVLDAPKLVTGGPDNVNIQSVPLPSGQMNEEWVRKLRPGTYSIQSSCGPTTFTLPAPPMNLGSEVTSTCPGGGRIQATGGRSATAWTTTGGIYTICNSADDTYELYNAAGTTLLATQSLNTPEFINLTPGETYRLKLRLTDLLGVVSCPIDEETVLIPFYKRPSLVATFGAICSGTTASIVANVKQGSAPFRYEIIGRAGSAVTKSDTTHTFANLPAGNYTIRVADECGISADFATSVGPLSFVATATRNCTGGISLCAPNIANATYIWSSDMDGNIGTTACVQTQNLSVGVYNVAVSIGTCNYSTTVSVAALSTPLTANAGADISNLTSTVSLAATPAPAGATGTWTVVNPSSGSLSFVNANSATTSVTATVNPGIYTLVWTVTSPTNTCIARDTMVLALQACAVFPAIVGTTSVVTQPTACTGAAGRGTVKAVANSGGVPPYNYRWSSGAQTAQVSGLAIGTYTVTIDDASACTPPIIKTVTLNAPAPTTQNKLVHICAGTTYTEPYSGTNQVLASGINPAIIVRNPNNTCDSLRIIVEVKVSAPRTEAITASKCPAQVLTIKGKQYANAGVFPADVILPTFKGCDSILYDITITDRLPVPDARPLSICVGDSVKIGKVFVKTAGTYLDTIQTTFSSTTSCDSIIRTNTLTVNSVGIVANVTKVKCAEFTRGSVEVFASGGAGNYTYVWSGSLPAQQNQPCTPRGTYTVTITDAQGCTASEVIVVDYIEPNQCLRENEGFTPDGDNFNENWEIPCLNGVGNSVKIYNRWGQIVYSQIDYKSDFHGIVNGTILPDGVYYYVVETDQDITNYNVIAHRRYRGTLTIIRH
jgi:gliding motility-associated-like protein